MHQARPRPLNTFLLAASACACALLATSSADAGQTTSYKPNAFTIAGHPGFSLKSDSILLPAVLVAFNPQPDPPGVNGDGSLIGLLRPTNPELFNPSTDGSFSFFLSLEGLAEGRVTTMPRAPGEDGLTEFQEIVGDHLIDVTFHFSPGIIDQRSWMTELGELNPPSDHPGDLNPPSEHNPPAYFIGGSFNFQGELDPYMDFTVSIDGNPLSFSMASAPEPASWALMLTGFAGLGGMLRLQRRRALNAAAI